MGRPYYPLWLDNLADDVTLEAAAMDGTARGAEDVRSILVSARAVYRAPGVHLCRPLRGGRRVSSRTTPAPLRGMPTYVVVLVSFNAAGQTQHVVVNHRPRSAMLQFSRVMLETFAGTPYAKHWEGTP